jgi:hypothetical protein
MLLRIKLSLSYSEPHYIFESKVEFTLGQAMNAQRRRRRSSCIALLFL